jgi:two-component system, NtrC family, response regulator AtoC
VEQASYTYVPSLSATMSSIQKMISELAPTDIPVLLVGESGTGKEIVARYIHSLSRYGSFPFVKLSCAALTPSELEGQLGKQSAIESGNGSSSPGTLFLDEIAELDPHCQRALLHTLPDGNGGGRTTFHSRVISCSTRDMDSELQAGRFRSELFYRLNGVCLELPALRQRKEDIPLLVRHFLTKYSRIFQRAETPISAVAMQIFCEYPWPGNIRQLENVIKRVVAVESEELGIADLKISPTASRLAHAPVVPRSLKVAAREASRQAERELILQALEKTHWNRKRAAQALQISYKSLLFKLKQIQVPDSEGV